MILLLAALLAAGCAATSAVKPLVAAQLASMSPEPSGSGASARARQAVPRGSLRADFGHADMVAALRGSGVPVIELAIVRQPFFSGTGRALIVDGAVVQAFEYPNAHARAADSDAISPDGYAIGSEVVLWVGEPHFWAIGRLIVLYVGNDESVSALLQEVLGPTVATQGQVAIYATVLRQLYSEGFAVGTLPETSPAYYVSSAVADPFGGQHAGAARGLSADVTAGVSAALGDLPGEIAWLRPGEQASVQDALGTVQLSALRFEGDGSALVSASIHLMTGPNLSRAYVVSHAGGYWQVERAVSVAWAD